MPTIINIKPIINSNESIKYFLVFLKIKAVLLNKFKTAFLSLTNMRKIILIILFLPLLFNSCQYFDKQVPSEKELLQKELKAINWKEVDEFPSIADCEKIVRQLSEKAVEFNDKAGVWIDINVGMNRTGIAPGDEALRLFRLVSDLPGLKAEGLHIYDGHIHESDYSLRKCLCDEAWATAEPMIAELKSGCGKLRIIAGGTPTFPFHAAKEGIETSPGTAVLWDYGYSSAFADLDFLHAAVLFTRVISKPGKDLICIDLGTKAVASEMTHPRIKLIGLSDYEFVAHNEEHLVIRTAKADSIEQGDELYCIPFHICPTVDRYDKVSVVRDGMVTEEWKVEARTRQITV